MGCHKREYVDEQGKDVWYYIFSHNGQRYRKSGLQTKRHAEMAEAKRKNEVMFEGKGALRGGRKKFAEVFDQYIEYRKKRTAKTTVEGEMTRRNPLVGHFGNRQVSTITSADINQYADMRRDGGLKSRTVNLELVLLRTLFPFAIQQGYLHQNPMIGVKDLKATKEEKGKARRKLDALTSTENMGKVFDAALEVSSKHKHTAYQVHVWCKTMATTGPRPSECFELEWTDVSFDLNSITYWSHKTDGSNRSVPMHPDLRQTLLEWKAIWDTTFLEKKHHNRVFFDPRCPRKPARSFNTSFRNAVKAAGIGKFSPKDFRHYFVSRSLMSGISELTVARWVGHQKTTMISRTYGHLVPAFHAAEMAKVKFA